MLDNALTRPAGSPAPSRDLPALRNRSAQVIVGIIWVHGPALLATMACVRQWSLTGIALWIGLALTATLAQRSAPAAARTRLTLAAALCAMPGLLVLVLDGHPWQIDAHMHFFAVLAVVTSLLDWRSVIAGAGVVALHHLTLNLVVPELVFPGGGDLARVLLHAGILTFEAAALAWLTHRAAMVMTAASAAAEEVLVLTKARSAAEQQTRLAAAMAQKAVMNRTADAFETKLGQLASVLSEDATALQTTAKSMSFSANRTNRQAGLVAAAANEASARAQTAAVAADALSASITEISRQVAHSSTIAERAVSEARQTDATVRALSESAEEIGHVVRLIVTISEQTNLLALNATIEAARAGHAGKGFAVVASEVKSLANQTSEATNGISAQIIHVQSAISQAVDAIRVITGTITEVRSVATIIAASIEEQGTATEEIARNVQRTATAAQDVTRNLEGVRQAANDTDAAADQVLGASGNVSERSVQLTTEVNEFVTDVRAA